MSGMLLFFEHVHFEVFQTYLQPLTLYNRCKWKSDKRCTVHSTVSACGKDWFNRAPLLPSRKAVEGTYMRNTSLPAHARRWQT